MTMWYTSLYVAVITIVSIHVYASAMLLNLTKGVKVNSLYAFESLVLMSTYGCAELCHRRKLCKSANFLTDKNICQLNTAMLSNVSVVTDDNAHYIQKISTQSVCIFSIHDLKLALVILISLLIIIQFVFLV